MDHTVRGIYVVTGVCHGPHSQRYMCSYRSLPWTTQSEVSMWLQESAMDAHSQRYLCSYRSLPWIHTVRGICLVTGVYHGPHSQRYLFSYRSLPWVNTVSSLHYNCAKLWYLILINYSTYQIIHRSIMRGI